MELLTELHFLIYFLKICKALRACPLCKWTAISNCARWNVGLTSTAQVTEIYNQGRSIVI